MSKIGKPNNKNGINGKIDKSDEYKEFDSLPAAYKHNIDKLKPKKFEPLSPIIMLLGFKF